MKVLVISDTHGKIENAKKIIEVMKTQGIKYILHGGDYVSDARLIQKAYPELQVEGVYGNCDVGFGGEYSKIVNIEGVSIYLTHGHRYGVKWGEYDELAIDAEAHGAEVAVCGHSHQAYLGYEKGVLIMNPGSLTLPRDSRWPSYGILEIEEGKIINANIMQILENGMIVSHENFGHFRVSRK